MGGWGAQVIAGVIHELGGASKVMIYTYTYLHHLTPFIHYQTLFLEINEFMNLELLTYSLHTIHTKGSRGIQGPDDPWWSQSQCRSPGSWWCRARRDHRAQRMWADLGHGEKPPLHRLCGQGSTHWWGTHSGGTPFKSKLPGWSFWVPSPGKICGSNHSQMGKKMGGFNEFMTLFYHVLPCFTHITLGYLGIWDFWLAFHGFPTGAELSRWPNRIWILSSGIQPRLGLKEDVKDQDIRGPSF